MRKRVPILALFALRNVCAAQSVAVVELFTSEACGNCPSAEAYLSDLVGQPRVIPLAFHVDYWGTGNDRDPLSDTLFEERQHGYVKRFDLESGYTPQMIVGGATEFVGSHRSTGDKAIAKTLREPSTTKIETSAKNDKGVVSVHFKLTGVTKEVVVNIALVQRSITVLKRNKEVVHRNVVRVLKSSTQPSGDVEITSPVKPEQCFVAAYAQDKKTWRVLGAAVAAIK